MFGQPLTVTGFAQVVLRRRDLDGSTVERQEEVAA